MRLTVVAATLLAAPSLTQAQGLSITGEGRMGILQETLSNPPFSDTEWALENRLVLHFNVAVAGDEGLRFGAHSRVQIDRGSARRFSGNHVFVEASNLRLSFGNLDGAILTSGTSHGFGGGCGVGYVGGHNCGDSAGLVGLVGLALDPFLSGDGVLAVGQAQEVDYTGGGHPAMARLDYSLGDTRVSVSHQRGGATELGVRSRIGALTLALGYANRASFGDVDVFFNSVRAVLHGQVLAASAAYDGGTWSVGVIGARVSYEGAFAAFDHTNWSISGNVDLAGGNLYAYVGRVHTAGINGRIPVRTMGLSYGYGLGGGATLTAGVERLEFTVIGLPSAWTSASLGVSFTF